jgi:predicted metal-dependent peptidase
MLKSYGFDEGKIKPVFGTQYDMDGTRYAAETIYRILPDFMTDKPLDMHDLWRQANDEDKRKIQDILRKARQAGLYTEQHDRQLGEIGSYEKQSKTRWRQILKPFVEPAVQDYSFERIDRRFGHVLIPDFYRSEKRLGSIWFLVDASGSMRSRNLYDCLEELVAVTKQYPRTESLISFFSNIVTDPTKFRSAKEVKDAFRTFKTTGGTSFDIIFKAFQDLFGHNKPKAIVILTDGYAKFPPESDIPRVPILWAINNGQITAPYGKTIRI